MIAILLCAGFGTRMYPLTLEQPKSLLEVAGRPVIDYLVDQLIRFPALEHVHVLCNARFFEHFAAWRTQTAARLERRGLSLHLHNDGVKNNAQRLGATGDLAFVLDRIGLPDGALIAAGDNIFLADLLPVWERFRQRRENLVMVLAQEDKQRLLRTGVVVLNDQDRIVQFFEKPATPPSPWVCLPCYFLTRSALQIVKQFVSRPDPPDAMGFMIHHLIGKEPVYAVKIEGSRLDIGNLADYRKAGSILSAN